VRLVLVSCVNKKWDVPCAARDLYISPWFEKARRYAEERGDDWRILSAAHGLVHPDQKLRPYNVWMGDLTARERAEWSDNVLGDVLAIVSPGDEVEILAGAQYRKHLEPALRRHGIRVTVPMKGLGIGQQLGWLKRRTS
jgi:hypothetical protein